MLCRKGKETKYNEVKNFNIIIKVAANSGICIALLRGNDQSHRNKECFEVVGGLLMKHPCVKLIQCHIGPIQKCNLHLCPAITQCPIFLKVYYSQNLTKVDHQSFYMSDF